MSLKKRVDELFQAIEESDEYQDYLNIKKVIEGNDDIKRLVADIKKLQQKSVRLEDKKDDSYKEVDLIVKEKFDELNSVPLYQEYIKRMNKLNDLLAESTFQIEKYINSKI